MLFQEGTNQRKYNLNRFYNIYKMFMNVKHYADVTVKQKNSTTRLCLQVGTKKDCI